MAQAQTEEIPSVEGSAKSRFAALTRFAVDLLVPPRCAACGRPIAEAHGLCAGCWPRLRLIERPYCDRLGTPFPYELGAGTLSTAAIADPPIYDRARAAAVYDDVARSLVHGLKYADRTELAVMMGRWMARAGDDILAGADVLVPVPLYRTRLWRRRFNQAAMLAHAVARMRTILVSTSALVRVRSTRQQVGLTARERAENVRGAFRVPAEQRIIVDGRHVVLVDDVLTSGATVSAATRALKRAGASKVDVLVFARVVGGDVETI
ncbi:MAG: ComF family protein [Hyphomicrobiales bacterium]|nr:ComF family protein [Hyphomicrobiales bacterium]